MACYTRIIRGRIRNITTRNDKHAGNDVLSIPRVDPKPPVVPPDWWDNTDEEDEED